MMWSMSDHAPNPRSRPNGRLRNAVALLAVCLLLPALTAGGGASQEAKPKDQKAPPRPARKPAPQTRPQAAPAPATPDGPLPKDFAETVRRDFQKLEHAEVTFQQYLALRQQEYHRLARLKKNPQLFYRPVLGDKTPCGNGDFEGGLNSAEWQGAYGVMPCGGTIDFTTLTEGIVGGPITNPNTHHTVVTSGTDPNVGIPLTAPGSSTSAVRIGNAVNGYGCELLSKTFVVTPAQSLLSFWYAVVLENPAAHASSTQPTFWVRVSDPSTGLEIPNLVNLGNGSSKCIADSQNPFFQTKPNSILVYRNWTCAQIDLSQQIGKTVTVEFITLDCAWGGHYGYAYLDNFCGGCLGNSSGYIGFAPATSSTCGPGQLCFNYTLPEDPTTGATGSVTITLEIWQNGSLVTTYTSPTLTSGSPNPYPFPISSSFLSTLTGTGFDVVAKGAFVLGGTTLPTMAVGTAPSGMTPGPNNDYLIACPDCCQSTQSPYYGPNLLQNPGFENGNILGINSSYTLPTLSPPAPLNVPGKYDVVTSAAALAISPNWVVTDHANCNSFAGAGVMVVNGRTMQPPGTKRVIWTQTRSVKEGGDYMFCFYAKNLPQCCNDIKPRLEMIVSGPGVTSLPAVTTTINIPGMPTDPGYGCQWQRVVGIYHLAPGATVTITVRLYEDGVGDGNDVALDDFSFRLIKPIPQTSPYLNVNYTAIENGATFTVTGTAPVAPPSGCSVLWQVCEWNGTGCVPGTAMSWPNMPTCNFPSYGGTTPGTFDSSKDYHFTYTLQCLCTEGTDVWHSGYNKALRKIEFKKAPPGSNSRIAGIAGLPYPSPAVGTPGLQSAPPPRAPAVSSDTPPVQSPPAARTRAEDRTANPPGQPTTGPWVIQGRVVDRNGRPLGKTAISLREKVAAESGPDGRFMVPLPKAEARVALTFQSAGHVANTRVFDPLAQNREVVVLFPIEHRMKFEASRGLDVKPGGAHLRIPAGALVGPDNRPFAGPAELHFQWFDVTDPAQRRAASGDYSGKLLDGRGCRLDSYGIFYLDIQGAKGEPLHLNREASIELSLEIPTKLRAAAPREVGFFELDTTDGRWVQAGAFTAAPNLASYHGRLSRLGKRLYNLDLPHNTTCVTVRVINLYDSAPRPNMAVVAHGLQSDSYGTSDANGYACLVVKRNAPFTAEASGWYGGSLYVTPTPAQLTAPNIGSDAQSCGDPMRCPFVGNIVVDLIVGEEAGLPRPSAEQKAPVAPGKGNARLPETAAAKPMLKLHVVERLKGGDRPVREAGIAILQQGRQVVREKSDSDGRLTVPLPAGTYTVRVTRAGLTFRPVIVEIRAGDVSKDVLIVATEAAPGSK